MSMRSQHAHGHGGDSLTLGTNNSGKKSEDHRRLVAVTAVEVVSQLALETKRDDVGTARVQQMTIIDGRLDHSLEHIPSAATTTGR